MKRIILLIAGLLIVVVLFWYAVGDVWTRVDFQVLDFFYKQALSRGHIPDASSQIVYLSITDETFEYFGKNDLDRGYLASVNDILANAGPAAVAYDIIFARSSDPETDQRFVESIQTLDCVYLPVAFRLSEQKSPFIWEDRPSYQKLRAEILKQPIEQGKSRPFYASAESLLQQDEFFEAAYNSGHINVETDPDGVYRHIIMLIKVDTGFIPTLSLAMFLDYVEVPLEEVIVEWGKAIRIPATPDSYLDEDVVIPIDEQGRTFIPFVQKWAQVSDTKTHMTIHGLLESAKDIRLKGNLADIFGGRFVFIADISQGFADIGSTPLDSDIPLVSIHNAVLNGLLANGFYRQWSFEHTLLLIAVIALLLMFAAFPKSSWILYLTGSLILIGLIGLTWYQFLQRILFPIASVGGSFVVMFVGLVIDLQVLMSRQQAFIRGVFARFVPDTVVEELLTHPEKLKLGGEAREITILFSDLQNFTTISEQFQPEQLVHLLNEYLTEMTNIIITTGGIIDKYLGDAIMAEFGAPLPVENHADLAVSAALKMQRRLHELRQKWAEQGLPELKCRIGINTGTVIIGNMGSDRVFDYTVIGDAVNLASRLEGVNKLYNTSLMISASTYHALTPNRFLTRIVDVIRVKGKSQAVKVYEVYGEVADAGAVPANQVPYYRTYQDAFDAYLSRNFTLALERFALVLQLRPNDPAAKWMISRIAALNPEELTDDWDGAVTLTSK